MEQANNQTVSNPTPNPTPKIVDNKPKINVMAVLAYILFFIPLMTGDAKKDSFVMFHTQQGAVIFFIELAIWILNWIFPWYLMWLHNLLSLVSLAILVFIAIGIMNVVKGEKKELPYIGKYASYFKF